MSTMGTVIVGQNGSTGKYAVVIELPVKVETFYDGWLRTHIFTSSLQIHLTWSS